MLAIISSVWDATADLLISKIEGRNLPFFRINTEDFPIETKLSWEIGQRGKCRAVIETEGGNLDFGEVSAIWWRRPNSPGPSIDENVLHPEARAFAETQAREALSMLWVELEDCLWVNHPLAVRRASSRLLQAREARTLGFEIPATLLTNDPEAVLRFFHEHQGGVVFKTLRQKPLRFGENLYSIYTTQVSVEDLGNLSSVKYTPVYLQENVRKKIELRITVVGDRVYGAQIDSQSSAEGRTDWRREDPLAQKWSPCELSEELRRKCVALTRRLGLQFGAIDLIVTPSEEIVFLEVNPNGQWGWLEVEVGIPISEGFIDLFYPS